MDTPHPEAAAHGAHTRAGRWLARRTLRGRLVAGLLALLFLACASVGVLTYAHLHSVLINGLNAELESANQRYVHCLEGPRPDGQPGAEPPGAKNPSSCAQQQGALTLIASFPTGSTRLTAYMASSENCQLSPADRELLFSLPSAGLNATSQPREVDLSAYGSYQVLSVRHGDEIVVTGMPLAPVNKTLNEVALAETAVFSVALLLTGLIGTAWVRVSLRPLRRVAATATRVTQLPLASGSVSLPERVPDADPRTEVGQVGTAFNRMLGHVESALARREASEARLRSFAADASHELRTPLAAIRGYAELARRSPDPLPPDIAHALGRVESDAARMSEIGRAHV